MLGKKFKHISRVKVNGVLSLNIFFKVAWKRKKQPVRSWYADGAEAGLRRGSVIRVWVLWQAALMTQARWPRREVYQAHNQSRCSRMPYLLVSNTHIWQDSILTCLQIHDNHAREPRPNTWTELKTETREFTINWNSIHLASTAKDKMKIGWCCHGDSIVTIANRPVALGKATELLWTPHGPAL